MSFVWGDDNIAYLHKRQQALVKNPLFYGMQYLRGSGPDQAVGPAADGRP